MLKHFCTVTVKGLVNELKIKVPWGHIAAKAWGPPTGRPILCLHGWADSANTFNKLIPLLPKEHYYVVLDLPGHGFSSHRPNGTPYYFASYLGDVRRVVEELEWSKFTIMGHSMGGNIAALFSSAFPHMVDQLILLDTYGFFPHSNEALLNRLQRGFEELIKWENKESSIKVYTPDAALSRLLESNKHLTEESGRILLERGSTEVPGGLIFNRDIRLNLTNPLVFTTDQVFDFQKKIQASVLIIFAKDGGIKEKGWFPEQSMMQRILDGYQTHITQFQLEWVEGNHFVHLNEPQQVAPLISDFLQKKVEPSKI
ncbi:serine hydrolase-like protein [Latimeria chalumnae]|uniref:serine hydrolase-like protein n=1 Tax=Latimeria chalumnae TaxID=7897 RepID=UPI00313E836E